MASGYHKRNANFYYKNSNITEVYKLNKDTSIETTYIPVITDISLVSMTVLSSLPRKKGRRLKFAHAHSRQSQFGQWGGALRGIHREQKDAVQQMFESNGWRGMLKWAMWCETESTALSTSLEEENCCHICLLYDFKVSGISMAPKVGQVFPYAACNNHSRLLFSLWTDPL